MIMLAVDALVLITLLKVFNDEDIGFGTAFLVAIAAAIGTFVLALVAVAALGLPGLFLAVVVAALLLGCAVSYLFGMEIKRSFGVAAIFMVAHLLIGMGINMMFGR